MSSRLVSAAFLLACAFGLEAQQNMFKIELIPSGAMVSLDQPQLVQGRYNFRAWPDGDSMSLSVTRVRKITRLTGKTADVVYRIDLNPSGVMVAKDNPTLKGGTYVFHTWRDGTLMSVRKSDVKKISQLTGLPAFRAQQEEMGGALIDNLAMEGTNQVIEIGTPPQAPGSSQAGLNSASSVGRPGINGAPVGNWQYQGTPGTSDAYGPANATMSDGVPTMPAATDGGAPPQQ